MLKIFTRFTDLIFENSCIICNESSKQNPICLSCENAFIIRNENNNVKSFDEITVYSWGVYENKLRDGIIALKTGKKKLANYFAKKLADFWKTLPRKNRERNYLVVPSPSHKQRIKERGYCQTTLMAAKFAEVTGSAFSNNLITRKKQTRYMNSLNDINERRENIKDAFEIINPINAKHILVIDDILTSGSTLCEFTRIINKAYPHINILGLTVAAGDKYKL